MSFRKIVFNGANVRAADHVAIFAGVLADGSLNGCEFDISPAENTLSMSKGYFIAAGRLIENNSDTDFSYSTSGGSYVQIKLRIDVSSDNISLDNKIVTTYGTNENDANFELTKQSINGGNGTIYDVELVVADITNGTIVRNMPYVSRPIHVINALPDNNDWSGYADGIYLIRQTEQVTE